MDLLNLAGFAAAMFVLAITPGPGVMATVSRALSAGFRNTVPMVLGIVAGDLVFLLFAIYGLSAIAGLFSGLFIVVRYLGSGYLIYLGLKLWLTKPVPGRATTLSPRSHLYSFWGGLSITLGNPKVVLFYLSFLPNFMHLDRLTFADTCLTAATVSLVLGCVMLFYAYSAARTRALFQSERAQKYMHRSAGAVMVGAGAMLAKNG